MSKKKKFNNRSFFSVLTGLSFIGMTVTGIVLFFTPPGRVANWTGWTMFKLTKHQWGDLHIWLSLIFIVASIFHTYYNWSVLLNYFKGKITKQYAFRMEWILSLIICIVVTLGTFYEIKPFSSLIDLNYTIKHSWEKEEEKAPLAHAELLTLKELAEKIGINIEAMKDNLAAKGIIVKSEDVIIDDLANDHDITPNELYHIAVGQKSKGCIKGKESISGQGYGGGLGRKTLQQFCNEEGIDVYQALERLEKVGIKADKNMTIRRIADQAELRPSKVTEIVNN